MASEDDKTGLLRRPLSTTEIEGACHWVKQFLAVAGGIVAGMLPVLGLVPMAAFFALVMGATYVTYTSLLTNSQAELLGIEAVSEFFKQGFFESCALFVLVWILTFTTLHH